MDFKCYFENCLNPSNCYCECTEGLAFICQSHLYKHFIDNDTIKHSIEVIYANIDPEEKALKLEQYRGLLEFMKNIESSINTELTDVINNLSSLQTQYINYFQEQRLVFEKLFETLDKEDKKINVPGYEALKFEFDLYNNYLSSINLDIISTSKGISQNIERIRNDIQSHKEFYCLEELNYLGNANLDDHLYCFKTGSKTFIEYNTLTLAKRNIEINVNENQGCLASVCQVPKKKIFYSGGCSPNLDTTYLIDIRTFAVEQLPKIKVRGYATATYFKDHIYIFGGYNGSNNFETADKFDLINKRWINIAPLPKAVHNVHVLPFKDYFFKFIFYLHKLRNILY